MEPFSKTGGLADVAGALPKALKDLGHDIRVIVPKYKMTDTVKYGIELIEKNIEIKVGYRKEKIEFYEAKVPGSDVIVYFIGNDGLFGRNGLYGEHGGDYWDNCERFVFFNKAALLFIKMLGWEPHVIHCNDWQTGLAPAYIKTALKNDPFYSSIASVYTIHNMGYLGLFAKEKLPVVGLGWEYFSRDSFEFWGNISFAKAGLIYSDVINTVSETYAKEIQTAEGGYGLDGLMSSRANDLYGIVNGVDYDIWDPETDENLAENYSPSRMGGKSANRKQLLKINGLPDKQGHMLVSVVSRLSDQKGFDIIAGAMDRIMQLPVQFVLLGTGAPYYENLFKDLSRKYPDKISANIGFDSAVAPLIYAGSDAFLMPSRYEPCGLGQLISFKYGTVPVVRRTGGLQDTVLDLGSDRKNGTGLTFDDYNSEALYGAVERAFTLFKKDRRAWDSLVKRIMSLDYSWDVSARKYLTLYKMAVERLSDSIRSSRAA